MKDSAWKYQPWGIYYLDETQAPSALFGLSATTSDTIGWQMLSVAMLFDSITIGILITVLVLDDNEIICSNWVRITNL